MREILFLTGVSGAGKSTAMSFLEDIGYYCIDNMPAELISVFIGLMEKNDEYHKIAIVADVRNKGVFPAFQEAVKNLKDEYTVKIIYLDCKNTALQKRYKLTRRKHPLADKFSGEIEKALVYEKKLLQPILQNADYVIDTSDLSAAELRERLTQILLDDDRDVMNLHVVSFGFKHGIPTDADFMLDVRCLPNPYWLESLRAKSGLDQEVTDYVFSFPETQELLDRLIALLDYLAPLYIKEGKSQLVIAIGCTGGNHRSVAIAEALARHFEQSWDNVTVNHRDINRR
ncbi:MAG: RNase adapter RapZ [Eubacterium sp.]|nr:RNase adapter RapZ [Eubacterium sp.]